MLLIGDVHGYHFKYKQLIKNHDSSIQLGDFGFNYNVLKTVSFKHRILPGNHENYPILRNYEHFLGNFGTIKEDAFEAFYVRGAASIDYAMRTPGHDWFPEEEIGFIEGQYALEAYSEEKPDIVLTHDCPSIVVNELFGYKTIFESMTGRLLSLMFEDHKPQAWFFGHHHKSVTRSIQGCEFTCLGILETIEV